MAVLITLTGPTPNFKSTVDKRFLSFAGCLHKFVKPVRAVLFQNLSDVIQKGTRPPTNMESKPSISGHSRALF